MGLVYLARDPILDREVALKTIRAELLDESHAPHAVARFRQEAMAAARLSHPGIVAIYDYAEDAGTAYIAMEYAPGENVGDYVARYGLTLPEIRELMTQLLEALEYAHDRGVVHRDIKPENLIVSGRLKIADFGVAHLANSRLTMAGQTIGTPGYMAPEQHTGEPVDHRVDVFAAGVLLYTLWTGCQPFPGETLAEITYK